MLVWLTACPASPEDRNDANAAAQGSYFENLVQTAFVHVLAEGLQEQDDEIKAHAEHVRESDACPPLRVTIDGAEVDFPYAYASVDEDDGSLKISLLDGDIVSCNGIRLPTVGRNRGLISFREAYASDENWARPESVIVEEIELDYLPRRQRFRSFGWRGGRILFHEQPPESQPVLLSESVSGDTVEACLPQLRVENTLWKGKDDLRGNRTTMTIEGTVRAKMCGSRITNDAWHAGNLECDPYYAEEAGAPIELDLFVDHEQEFGLIGFRQDTAATCESLTSHGMPFISTKILFEVSDDPDVGIASTNTSDDGADVSNSFFGNSISPLGPRAERSMCLHRPLYWYREGRVGFVHGTLVPKRCSSRSEADPAEQLEAQGA